MKDDVPKYIFVKDVLGEQNIAHVYVKKKCKIHKNEYTYFGGNENFNKPITHFLQIAD